MKRADKGLGHYEDVDHGDGSCSQRWVPDAPASRVGKTGKKPAKRPERLMLRLELHAGRAGLFAMDEPTKQRMKAKGFKIGDELSAHLKKARNVSFHRRAHAFGGMMVENVESFTGLDHHSALKRLQIESGIGCDSTAIYVPGVGMCEHRLPRSLSFEELDDGEFQPLIFGLYRHAGKTYFGGMDERAVEEMVQLFEGGTP